MAHHRRILDPNFPVHITARRNNREVFPIPISDCWTLFEDYLHYLATCHQIQILSFVLMPNHFHLICRDPFLQISKGMSILMRETSKEMSFLSGRINRIWGSPFHSSIITDPLYFLHAYKYVYRNPVAAGLCASVEEYPWSTLQILLGQKHGLIPLQPDETLFDDVEGTLRWLNQSYSKEEISALGFAFRRKVFHIPRNTKDGEVNPLTRKVKFDSANCKNPGGGF